MSDNMFSMTDYLDRLMQKQEAIDRRKLEDGICLCDYCRTRPGAEFHEWLSRHATIAQREYRILSFQPPICSLLCRGCHQVRATTPDGKKILLERNVNLYGEEKVCTAAERIPQTFWRYLLPDLFALCRSRRA